MFEFGNWLRRERSKRKLDLKSTATLTGVNVGSLSRIERHEVEPLHSTVVRICDAFNVEWVNFYSEFRELSPQDTQITSQFLEIERGDDTMPSWGRVGSFIKLLEREPREAYTELGRLAVRVSSESFPMHDVDINLIYELPRLIFNKVSFFTLNIIPNPELDWRHYHLLYRFGSPILFSEVGVIVQKRRTSNKNSSNALKPYISRSMISRIENGQVDRLKFADALLLDEHLGSNGDIFGMFWLAARLQNWFSGTFTLHNQTSHIEKANLVIPFIQLSRWSWLKETDDQRISRLVDDYNFQH